MFEIQSDARTKLKYEVHRFFTTDRMNESLNTLDLSQP